MGSGAGDGSGVPLIARSALVRKSTATAPSIV